MKTGHQAAPGPARRDASESISGATYCDSRVVRARFFARSIISKLHRDAASASNRLDRLAEEWLRVAMGSSGAFRTPGTASCWDRMQAGCSCVASGQRDLPGI